MPWTISKALMQDFVNSHSSPGQAAESSGGSSSVGELLQQLNGNPTRQVYLCNDKTTGPYPRSRFGMTCAHLTADHGQAVLTWFLEASRVKTSAAQAKAPVSPVVAADYGRRWRELSGKYNHDSHLWKTRPSLWDEGLTSSLQTLPRWGLMRDGQLWERVMLARLTNETAYGSLPTPVKYDRSGIWESNNYHGLGWKARHEWPTPICSDAKVGKAMKVLLDVEAGTAFNQLAREVRKQQHIDDATWPTPMTTGLRGGSGVPKDLDARLNAPPKFWPTPVKNEDRAAAYTVETSRRHFLTGEHQVHLSQAVRDPIMFPTPTCTQPKMPTATLIARSQDKTHKGRTSVPLVEVLQRETLKKEQLRIETPMTTGLRGGSGSEHWPGKYGNPTSIEYGDLSPNWVEWLMSWAIGWTDLNPLPKEAMADWLRLQDAGEHGVTAWWLVDPSDNPDSGINKTVPAVRGRAEATRTSRIAALGNGQVSTVIPAVWTFLWNLPQPD